MPERTIRLIRDGFPEDMALDTAVSRVLLTEASAPRAPETIRLTIPGRAVAFGKHDAVVPGFNDAVAAARDAGYQAIVRMAGGRAAVFHEGTVALSWTIPEAHPITGIRDRFGETARLLVSAFADLGIDAEIGELPGEYCPGEFSVHVGRAKVAGLGQRLTRSAAHIGGVIVVRDGSAVRDVLGPVYAALGIEWDPATAGALEDLTAEVTPRDVIETLIESLRNEADLRPVPLAAGILDSAQAMSVDFSAG